MDIKNLEKTKDFLHTLIPDGLELEVQSYERPRLQSLPIAANEPVNYVVRIVFPYKLSLPLKRPSNSFCISYRTETLNIPEDRWRVIVNDLLSQEKSQRNSIRLKLEAARRQQFLAEGKLGNIRVSGDSFRDDITVQEIRI